MPFKVCPSCRRGWETREEFLSDPEIVLCGYQANFLRLEAGFFLFQHSQEGCDTSLGVEAREFLDLHEGPVFEVPRSDVMCQGLCSQMKVLGPCENECECRYVRDVLQKVRAWPKRPQEAA
jgi:hypothetical protein